MIEVELVCIEAVRQIRRTLQLAPGSTVADAIAASGIERELGGVHPERIGVFNQRVERATVLKDGDRVEIYRPLIIDPKEARRLRAHKRP